MRCRNGADARVVAVVERYVFAIGVDTVERVERVFVDACDVGGLLAATVVEDYVCNRNAFGKRAFYPLVATDLNGFGEFFARPSAKVLGLIVRPCVEVYFFPIGFTEVNEEGFWTDFVCF